MTCGVTVFDDNVGALLVALVTCTLSLFAKP